MAGACLVLPRALVARVTSKSCCKGQISDPVASLAGATGKVWTAGRLPPSCSPFAIHGWSHRSDVLATGTSSNRERRNKVRHGIDADTPRRRSTAPLSGTSSHLQILASPLGRRTSGSFARRTPPENRGYGRNRFATRKPWTRRRTQRRCRIPLRLTPISEDWRLRFRMGRPRRSQSAPQRPPIQEPSRRKHRARVRTFALPSRGFRTPHYECLPPRASLSQAVASDCITKAVLPLRQP